MSLFNNVNTLRGALAAWRQVHVRERLPWPLQSDPFAVMLRRATTNLMAERSPRHALRQDRAVAVIMRAHEKGSEKWLQVAAVVGCPGLRA